MVFLRVPEETKQFKSFKTRLDVGIAPLCKFKNAAPALTFPSFIVLKRFIYLNIFAINQITTNQLSHDLQLLGSIRVLVQSLCMTGNQTDTTRANRIDESYLLQAIGINLEFITVMVYLLFTDMRLQFPYFVFSVRFVTFIYSKIMQKTLQLLFLKISLPL